jgi:hypothetical protein
MIDMVGVIFFLFFGVKQLLVTLVSPPFCFPFFAATKSLSLAAVRLEHELALALALRSAANSYPRVLCCRCPEHSRYPAYPRWASLWHSHVPPNPVDDGQGKTIIAHSFNRSTLRPVHFSLRETAGDLYLIKSVLPISGAWFSLRTFIYVFVFSVQ